jgi:hypothetical protein
MIMEDCQWQPSDLFGTLREAATDYSPLSEFAEHETVAAPIKLSADFKRLRTRRVYNASTGRIGVLLTRLAMLVSI